MEFQVSFAPQLGIWPPKEAWPGQETGPQRGLWEDDMEFQVQGATIPPRG